MSHEGRTINPKEIRTLLNEHNFPFVINNTLDWDCLQWDIQKWQDVLQSENLKFRLGKWIYTKYPQYEHLSKTKTSNLKELFEYNESDEFWAYFDYKHLRDYIKNNKELRENISWNKFGINEYSVDDSTIWIGTKGAHSNCHKDTYGTNLIAQVLGRKRWILFPPDENLLASRVPFEESTIYSELNLFSPKIEDFKDIKNCYSVVLNPGDVLFMPSNWWHYVENLECAISINIWLPHKKDPFKRLQEAVTQLLILQFADTMPTDIRKVFLNEENYKYKERMNLDACLTDVKNALNEYKGQIEETTEDTEMDISKFTNLNPVPKLIKEEFNTVIISQFNRFKSTSIEEISSSLNCRILRNVINKIVSPTVIDSIINDLLNNY